VWWCTDYLLSVWFVGQVEKPFANMQWEAEQHGAKRALKEKAANVDDHHGDIEEAKDPSMK